MEIVRNKHHKLPPNPKKPPLLEKISLVELHEIPQFSNIYDHWKIIESYISKKNTMFDLATLMYETNLCFSNMIRKLSDGNKDVINFVSINLELINDTKLVITNHWLQNNPAARAVYEYTYYSTNTSTRLDILYFRLICLIDCVLTYKLATTDKKSVKRYQKPINVVTRKKRSHYDKRIRNPLYFAIRDFDVFNNINCEKHKLPPKEKPIVEYSAKHLLRFISIVDTLWYKFIYSKNIIKLIEVLEIAVAWFVVLNHPDSRLNLKKYRIRVHSTSRNKEMYRVNDIFINIMAWKFYDYYESQWMRQVLSKKIKYKYTNRFRKLEEECKRFEAWAIKQSESLNSQSIFKKFKPVYERMHVRPGEDERFKVQHKHKNKTQANVIEVFRGRDVTGHLFQKLSLPAKDFLVSVKKDGRVDNLLKSYMQAIIVDVFFNNFYNIEWLKKYVYYRWQTAHNIKFIQTEPIPIILQSFNHFDFYFRGGLVPCNSFSKAFVLWLHHINDHWELMVDGKYINDLAHSILL